MNYCTCGALLVPDARFCHKCGRDLKAEASQEPEVVADPVVEAPVVAAPPPPAAPLGINFHNSIAVRVGFLAAGLITLMALFPLPDLLAAVWRIVMLLAGGFFAVYLYSRRTGQALSVGGGARIGWITGVFCFVITTVLFTISIAAISAENGLKDQFRKMAENSPGREFLNQMMQSDSGMAQLIILMLIIGFLSSIIFPIVGGAIGAKVLEKE